MVLRNAFCYINYISPLLSYIVWGVGCFLAVQRVWTLKQNASSAGPTMSASFPLCVNGLTNRYISFPSVSLGKVSFGELKVCTSCLLS